MPTLLGLNSGTSADGVDAAVVSFDGERPAFPVKVHACLHREYPKSVQADLDEIFSSWKGRLDKLCHLNWAVGQVFADTAVEVLDQAGMKPDRIDVVGSHGQTIYHLPDDEHVRAKGLVPSTLQIGEPSLIAARLGRPVAADLRAADIAAGGQGAPLTPILDHLLFTDPKRSRLRLNLGGIANLTWLPPAATSDQVVAFDTGPSNLLIDATVQLMTDGAEAFDEGGARARQGSVNDALLAAWLADEYFQRAPPKTTGREFFNAEWVKRARSQTKVSDADFLATITALTPASVVHAVENHLPPGSSPDEVILHGGGANNQTVVDGLRSRLPGKTRISTVEEFGIPLQALEPLMFAVLGWLCLRREPVFYPNATGAKRPAVLGKLLWPADAR
jgi:anhydro-N-acetylmuramic acid kinase